ncbi:phospholipase A2, membrane associated [Arvicanthis niloticus]|uniref:phospholipase A2, membrane associated n=1 Tax=Arvicanthis niloticus TaxID=61156 RepID=UPI001485E6D8|nr:phospholipase A2, membrane associated [Arvicanthis niloticus]XP_034358425.1 phospholipase A2, membrane associated [Arvicanthis niloticus]XP_034358426.1 phospholipase A2, membrane associated [Arvicanthis niloticus]
MKVLLLLAAMIMAFGSVQVQGSILEFGQMIRFKTGKRADVGYAFYGCHCGVGGTGAPKDATDWCCVTHDCCYYRLEKYGCGTKFLTYKYSIGGGQITCSANQNSCQKQLCQCDKAAAECFAKNKKSYSLKYQFYPNNFCRGKTPSC